MPDIGAGGFRNPRTLGHPLLFAAGKLNHMGTNARSFTAQPRHRLAIDEIIARGHFGDDQTCPQDCGQASERRIRDARHWRQKNPVSDLKITYFQWVMPRRGETSHESLVCFTGAVTR